MALTVEATYENGSLRLDQPLPLKEQEKVRVTVHILSRGILDNYGLLGWTGDAETLRYLAEDVELDPQEGT